MTFCRVSASTQGCPPDSILALFSEPALSLSREYIDQPPRKRRKGIHAEGGICCSPTVDGNHEVVAARVDIDLLFSNNEAPFLCASKEVAWDESKQTQVLLQRLDKVDSTTFRLRLATVAGECLLESTLQSDALAAVLGNLRPAIISSTSTPQRQDGHIPGVTRSDCFLCPSVRSGAFHLLLKSRMVWKEEPYPSDKVMRQKSELLHKCFPDMRYSDTLAVLTPREFYGSVHVPDKSEEGLNTNQLAQLHCQLYPFQSRAVRWMLRREGVDVSEKEIIPYLPATGEAKPPHDFLRTLDAVGHQCFVNHMLGIATANVTSLLDPAMSIRGGILAEEMGLGKTVELITLITLHRPPPLSHHQAREDITQAHLRRSSATLIIAPPALLQQWKSEIAAHAPGLSVSQYQGLRAQHGALDSEELVRNLLVQDIVLTTYNVLASEIHYTGSVRDRSLRHEKKYKSRQSPLVQICWWRVCLDEAQMVESGLSNAAMVARLVPRCNAWAVSGTPVRRDIRDLLGLLMFLRYEPYCRSPYLWNELVTSRKATFQAIFGQITLRHTKDHIREELSLEPQKRVVIHVPFTPVEEQHYAHLFQQMCDDCDLNLDGSPLTTDWNPDCPSMVEKMRAWLTRLRQTCLHPEVGVRNRRALGSGDGPLRTADAVLEVMIEQNETCIRAEERALLMSQIRRGQILENENRSEAALTIWLEALERSKLIVRECRLELAEETDNQWAVHNRADTAAQSQEDSASVRHVGVRRQRLRSALELEHACTFFQASAYYQIKSNDQLTPPGSCRYAKLERAEELAYDKAKQLRKELLSEAHRKATALMKSVEQTTQRQAQILIPKTCLLENHGGIESRKIALNVNDLCEVFNQQREHLNDWRIKMASLLLQPLVDEEDTVELKGDEYETSTKQQDEIYVYMDALGAVLSDRHDALTGQKNGRMDHEVKVALQMAAAEEGHCPSLTKELMATRAALQRQSGLGSLRGCINELRVLRTALEGGNNRAIAELRVVDETLQALQRILDEQTKAVAGLWKELNIFRDTMNSRLEFYRQLQRISDSVAPYDGELKSDTTETVLSQMKNAEAILSVKVAALKAKERYLMHLRTESRCEGTQRTCVICQQTFEVGALTVCGHQYCKECMRLWWSEHRTCPICKKHLTRNDLHQITYKPQEITVQEERQQMKHEKDQGTAQASIYAGISDTILCQIKNIDLDGSFGMKIDTLARHILWIRENDPGSKSIIFSQYKDFLDVLARAFAQFKIGFSSIDRRGGTERFKKDSGVECFLLHAKAHSSGLNLVNATHVFLCEPLINTAIELQAIARVHRIGQYRPTTVWMYLISGTVEESIYDISVARRMLHVSSNPRDAPQATAAQLLEETIDAANSLELQQTPISKFLTKGSGGGELVEKEDLWNCLFRKP